MDNNERKRRDIYNSVEDCLLTGMTLNKACQIVGFKFYMTPEATRNLYLAIKKAKGENGNTEISD